MACAWLLPVVLSGATAGVPLSGAVAPRGNPTCWSQGYTYEKCCVQYSPCWDATYTYSTCCETPPSQTQQRDSRGPAQPASPGDSQEKAPAHTLALHASSDESMPEKRHVGADAEVYRQDHARRSSAYLQSSTQWLARARHAQAQQALAALERQSGKRSDGKEPQTALVLNSPLWGAVTELLAGVELGGKADSAMWGQAANTMVEIAKIGKELSPSIFDPDGLDAHTEALLLRACELAKCSQLPLPVHDLSVEEA